MYAIYNYRSSSSSTSTMTMEFKLRFKSKSTIDLVDFVFHPLLHSPSFPSGAVCSSPRLRDVAGILATTRLDAGDTRRHVIIGDTLTTTPERMANNGEQQCPVTWEDEGGDAENRGGMRVSGWRTLGMVSNERHTTMTNDQRRGPRTRTDDQRPTTRTCDEWRTTTAKDRRPTTTYDGRTTGAGCWTNGQR
ncbi:hypothetical protein BDN70DRAFT_901888 [Pholiota conissans]|uniref:Uncharacterized protein n=1 Tax=Pholiota conissans TaxID=109636 RepID=A0A9P6CLJ2_9AGAR|nr:hypothetical protein BDN70DRAFT_901888 [Pholiota conissans]